MLFNEIFRILEFVLQSFVKIWPLLLITIPLAVVLRSIHISEKINEWLSKNTYISILIATFIGALAPFCSCSVIPVISSMLIAGVPIAPVMSFWLASPSMDPEIFFLSVASLGYPLAIARITATLIMSLTGGYITYYYLGKGDAYKHLKITSNAKISNACACDSSTTSSSSSSDSTKDEATKSNLFKHTNAKELINNSISSIKFVLKFLFIAYILEALIIFYVSEDLITVILGGSSLVSVLKSTLLSIPLYTTNLSALGIIGGLLEKNLSEGAALSFLIGGATTTIPAMSAVYQLVHKKVFFIYIFTAIGFSLLSGLLFNLF